MQFFGKMFSSVSDFYKDINPSTLSGAIDIIVFEDGDPSQDSPTDPSIRERRLLSRRCTPFHVRFGKLQVLRPQDKRVVVSVNDQEIPEVDMKIGLEGEAVFVLPVKRSASPSSPDQVTSPLVRPIDSPPPTTNTSASSSNPNPLALPIRAPSPLVLDSPPPPTTAADAIASTARKDPELDWNELYTVIEGEDWLLLHLERLFKLLEQQPQQPNQGMSGFRFFRVKRGEYLWRGPSVDLPRRLWEQQQGQPSSSLMEAALELAQRRERPVQDALAEEGIAIYFPPLMTPEMGIILPADLVLLVGLASVFSGLNSVRKSLHFYLELASNGHRDASVRDLGKPKPASTIASSSGWRSWLLRSKPDSSSVPQLQVPPPTLAPPPTITTTPSLLDRKPPAQEEEETVFVKSVRLPGHLLALLPLHPGPNTVSFTILHGKASCTARIFLYDSKRTRFVVSDVDGTITKSDALGHIFAAVGRDWTHPNIASLYTQIARNGYAFIYLTARAIGQATYTRNFLAGIRQEGGKVLPDGPLIMSPDRLFAALRREVIVGNPEAFKMEALEGIRRSFCTHNNNDNNETTDLPPFYAGFGNRQTDAKAYVSAGIPPWRIFTVNPAGSVSFEHVRHHLSAASSYAKLVDLVDAVFPPLGCGSSLLQVEDVAAYGDFGYWHAAIPWSGVRSSPPPPINNAGDFAGLAAGGCSPTMMPMDPFMREHLATVLAESARKTHLLRLSSHKDPMNLLPVESIEVLSEGLDLTTELLPVDLEYDFGEESSAGLFLGDANNNNGIVDATSSSNSSPKTATTVLVDATITASPKKAQPQQQQQNDSAPLDTDEEPPFKYPH